MSTKINQSQSLPFYTPYREVCERTLTQIPDTWSASAYLSAEKMYYIRVNQGRVRQITLVEQAYVNCKLQKDQKQWTIELSLSGHPQQDISSLQFFITQAIQHWEQLEPDSRVVPLTFTTPTKYHELSHEVFDVEVTEKFKQWLNQIPRGDLCGLFCYGHSYVFSLNSLGIEREFLNLNGFFDYSLFAKNVLGQAKASKDTYFFQSFLPDLLEERWQKKQQEVSLLIKRPRPLERGLYRAYLTPNAVAELLMTMSWGGFSYDAFRKGTCPLEACFKGERDFSPLLTMQENFDLQLGPSFNSFGELPPRQLLFIQAGKRKNLLVSSGSAKKYNVNSNFAEGQMGWGYESPRSLEILPGNLMESKILWSLDQGLYLDALHYCNWSHPQSARITGMSRFACFWVENGCIQYPIEDFRFDVSLYDLWGPSGLIALSQKADIIPRTDTYSARSIGGLKTPGFLVDGFRCVL